MLIWNFLGSCLDSLCKLPCRCALQSSRPPALSELWRSVLQCSRCASPAKTEVFFLEEQSDSSCQQRESMDTDLGLHIWCRGARSGVCSTMGADTLKFLYASVFFIRKILIDICSYGSKKVNKCINVTTFHF